MDSPKDQIIERLQQANNVLLTVSTNPSVDQLAAVIGLTLWLNKLGKHATAVFSGEVPSTIEFLQPEKTLEKNTDSLRDFIIALDKSKADKLRYKVEDQMVKIFITPYRTSITDKDLDFSQGDFNVEVVIALGVNEQKDLDQAITSHGRILHDATVISASTHDGSSLGSINWVKSDASSLCEMMLDIGLSLKPEALDAQMATALLAGIVAETNRFSNEKTSSVTMQMSAKLMAAGANQQLVASQLQPPAPVEVAKPKSKKANLESPDAELPAVDAVVPTAELEDISSSSDGSLTIEHGKTKPLIDLDSEPDEPQEDPLEQIRIESDGTLKKEQELPDESSKKVIEPLKNPDQPEDSGHPILQPPSLGGTLTANTIPEALDPSLDPLGVSASPNPPLLSHDSADAKVTATTETELHKPEASLTADDYIDSANPFTQNDTPAPNPSFDDVVTGDSQSSDTLTELEKEVDSPHLESASSENVSESPALEVDVARDAVMDAVNSSQPGVLEPVQSLNAQPMDLNLGNSPVPEPFAPGMPPVESPNSDIPNGMINPNLSANFPTLDAPVIQSPTDVDDSVAVNTTAPPPVPPPMMPPTTPSPSSDSLGNTPL